MGCCASTSPKCHPDKAGDDGSAVSSLTPQEASSEADKVVATESDAVPPKESLAIAEEAQPAKDSAEAAEAVEPKDLPPKAAEAVEPKDLPPKVVAKESQALPPKVSHGAGEEVAGERPFHQALCCCSSNGEQVDKEEGFVRIEEVAEEYDPPKESHVVAEEETTLEEEEVTYPLNDKKSLGAFLQDADVRLIRAEWLFHLRRSEMPLPRRQEAEHETFKVGSVAMSALVTHEEVADWASGDRDAIICSVSHAWETREHPDPCCWQLGRLVDCLLLYDAAYFSNVWVFYDYTSLYQYERQSQHQQDSFSKGMQNMHVMYAHDFSLTLRIHCLTPDETWNAAIADIERKIPVFHQPSGAVKPLPLADLVHNRTLYEERGWCKAEMEWSAARGIFVQNLRIDGAGTDGQSWFFNGEMHHFGGRVPQSPQVFEQGLATSAFTHRNDAPEVLRLQRKIFYEKVTVAREVCFEWLPSSEVGKLIKALPNYKELRVFRLRHIQATAAQLKALVQALSTKELRTLEIRGVRKIGTTTYWEASELTILLAKAVAEMVKVTNSLKVLDLQDNLFGRDGAEALLEALQSNRTVTKIHLYEFDFGIGKEVRREIETLVWQNQGVEEKEAPKDESKNSGAFPSPPRIKMLAERILTLNMAITTLHFRGPDKLSDEELKALAAALKENRQVTELNLEFADIGDARAEVLAEMLQQNRAIRTIYLEDNPFTTVGAKALLEALRVNKTVTKISVGHFHDRISSEVKRDIREVVRANVLAEFFLTLDSVTEIDLRGWQFSGKETKVLAAALKENKMVTRINLSRNDIGDGGAQALAEILHENRTIKRIDLRLNGITTAGAKALLDAVQINKVVTEIYLDDNNGISEEVMKEIGDILEARLIEEGKLEIFDFSVQKFGGHLGIDVRHRRVDLVVASIADHGAVVETNNAIAEPTERLQEPRKSPYSESSQRCQKS